MDEDRQHQE
jgi:hypothetical protein